MTRKDGLISNFGLEEIVDLSGEFMLATLPFDNPGFSRNISLEEGEKLGISSIREFDAQGREIYAYLTGDDIDHRYARVKGLLIYTGSRKVNNQIF
jgi:hypothetical protein